MFHRIHIIYNLTSISHQLVFCTFIANTNISIVHGKKIKKNK